MASDGPPWIQDLVQTLAKLSLSLSKGSNQQVNESQAKLDQLIVMVEQSLQNQGELKVAAEELNAALDQLGSNISTEFGEIAAKVDALEAALPDNSAVQAELDDLRNAVAAATERVQGYANEVGTLSTAGDDAPA